MSFPKKQTKGVWRRSEILEASVAVFGKNGFSQTRIVDIARECGVASQLIYRYFDSKEALYKEAVQLQIERVLEAAVTAVVDLDFPFLTGEYNKYMIAKILSDPLLVRFNKDATIDKICWWLESASCERNLEAFAEEVRLAQAAGVVRSNIDAKLAAEAVYRMSVWIITPRLSDFTTLQRDMPSVEYVLMATLFDEIPSPEDLTARKEFAESVHERLVRFRNLST